jgi:hypothetical protein
MEKSFINGGTGNPYKKLKSTPVNSPAAAFIKIKVVTYYCIMLY